MLFLNSVRLVSDNALVRSITRDMGKLIICSTCYINCTANAFIELNREEILRKERKESTTKANNIYRNSIAIFFLFAVQLM